jgi:hypothetical protein
MEQSPSWEANYCSASQKIPHVLRKLKFRYCVHKSATGPYLDQDEFIPHPSSLRSILIVLSHVCLGLPSGLFPLGFR